MNASAMVKHHQAVTAIMTQAMSDYASAATGTPWNNACFAFEADAILCALSRAGFRVLGPDEVDPVTVERCAKLVEHGYDKPVGKPWREDGKQSKNDKCPHDRYMYNDCELCAAIAIRALASGESR